MKRIRIVIVLVILGLFTSCSKKDKDKDYYEDAMDLYNSGEYAEAADMFMKLGDYEDSLDLYMDSEYKYALSLYDDGDYEEALLVLEELGAYEDSATIINSINEELTRQLYEPIYDMLEGETRYYNGGSDTVLCSISFSGTNVTIKQMISDGNGVHVGATNDYPYTVSDTFIEVEKSGGSTMRIPYVLSGNTLTLGNGDYYSLEEIDDALQGYWKLRESGNDSFMGCAAELNVYINNGSWTYEHASEAYGSSYGEYYYYGPYSGNYSLNSSGGFSGSMEYRYEFSFNIIDGTVKLLHFGHVCTRTTGLPGQYGYSF